jgi:hypothetical protein
VDHFIGGGSIGVYLGLCLGPPAKAGVRSKQGAVHKRGVFNGIVDLQAAINRFVRETNDKPKPFTWTADPDAIIEKVRRGKQALESIH